MIRPLVLAGLALALAACGAAGSSSGAVVARSGSLEVQGAYLPQPASPDVAAAYFILRNNGASADTLLAADSPAAAQALPMTSGEGTDEDGMGLMAPIKSLVVPAHGAVTFTPGGDHLMLEGLTEHLTVGQTVVLDLHFARSGVVAVPVPVVPLDRILGSNGS